MTTAILRLLTLTLFSVAGLSGKPIQEFVFGRNPGFEQCHASTLVQLKDGTVVAAWFAGKHEKADDVGIWLSRRVKGKWTPPARVAKIRQDPHWNPVLFESPSGKLILYFKVGKEIPAWETWVQTSTDGGRSWSKATELVAGDHGGRGPVKNKPILLSDGSWLAGASHEGKEGDHPFVDRSTDGGKTWVATPHLPLGDASLQGVRLIQPTLWESAPGQVHMLLRSSCGYICRSDSKDYGRSWSPVYKTDLGNPNSGIDLTRLDNGVLVLAYNPDNHDEGSRAPLWLALSYDNGKTWPKHLALETGKPDDEYSYPAVVHRGETISVTYTWQRRNVRFWQGTQKDLEVAQ